MDTKQIQEKFRTLFGDTYRVYTSPGRINLIGEHTDYNGGFVFPGAIDKGIYAAIQANGGDKVRVYSLDYEAMSEFGMREEDLPQEAWAVLYVRFRREGTESTALTLFLPVMFRLVQACRHQRH